MSDVDKQDTTQTTDDSVKTEPVKKVEITIDSLNTMYNENPQIFEQWIKDEPVAKKALASWKDSQVSQGINTFKENSLPSLIEQEIEKVKSQYSKKLDPIDALRAEMETKLNEEKNARKRAEIKSKASEYVTKLGLTLDKIQIDDFIAGTEEDTIERINRFYERDKSIKSIVEEQFKKTFIKDNNYVPPTGNNEAVPFGGDEKAWAAAIKAGKSPASGPEFMRINDAMDKFHGRK